LDANLLLGLLLLFGMVLLGFGVMFGIVKPGSIIRWIIFLTIIIPVAVRIGVNLLQRFHHQYGNLPFFIIICVAIVGIMFCFPFTSAVLASTIGAFIYDHIRLLLLFTGVGAILTGLVDSLSRWLMQ